MMYLPMTTKLNHQMWDVLTATIKHMSPSQKECVLCMDEISLKLNLFYNTNGQRFLWSWYFRGPISHAKDKKIIYLM